jgi:cell shape-determining protein MreC
MKWLTRNDRIDDGMTVVTAGTTSDSDKLQSVYPPGIPIGEVTTVSDRGTDAQEAHVRPFADLRRLEFVQVLTSRANGNRGAQR